VPNALHSSPVPGLSPASAKFLVRTSAPLRSETPQHNQHRTINNHPTHTHLRYEPMVPQAAGQSGKRKTATQSLTGASAGSGAAAESSRSGRRIAPGAHRAQLRTSNLHPSVCAPPPHLPPKVPTTRDSIAAQRAKLKRHDP